ncbi:hypothetical protein U9M48_018230 [Paspalum notatum var. saurae]|uniref:Uncharacterized protein n=1 Tax=Paspalum notatum var. saurae TaxID=547442 RepID=A0AAQ3WPX9_PASNO
MASAFVTTASSLGVMAMAGPGWRCGKDAQFKLLLGRAANTLKRCPMPASNVVCLPLQSLLKQSLVKLVAMETLASRTYWSLEGSISLTSPPASPCCKADVTNWDNHFLEEEKPERSIRATASSLRTRGTKTVSGVRLLLLLCISWARRQEMVDETQEHWWEGTPCTNEERAPPGILERKEMTWG